MGMLKKLFGLRDKVIIVTGASKGIGKDISIMLAQLGAELALVARDENELKKLVEEVESYGTRALPVPLDLTNLDEIPNAIQDIYKYFGRIDVLINNAGTNVQKSAVEVTETDWDTVLDINLKSVFFLTREVGKYMIPVRKGKIINMSSQMALVGYFNRAAYCSSKGGVMQLTKALAVEWAKYNINVNSIAPTFIKTPMTTPMFEDEEFLKDVLYRIPMGRLGETEDLFGAIIYLSSTSSDLVTGHTLSVDGGWTTW